ncbi:MAG: hypothetical protein M1828_004642 [Chrysothrix sp. TS-e1954]|nr:MAG: hypothetical protein M1828_004642 [Chrysothrix sp. TS-e1954]
MPIDFPANTASDKQITPEVTWAQRSSSSDEEKNFVYVTISVPDVPAKDMKLDLKPTGLTFTGPSESKKATYHVAMDFFAEIDTEKSKIHNSQRDVELKLQKKELNEEYWPRLLKDKQRVHYLKTDFDKWVDEDEQDGVPDDDYMSQMGGGAGGMPGMPGMGGMGGMGGEGGFGGLDFSKLGGGAGMPDLGDMGAMGGAEDEDDDEGEDDGDDDMPALEGEGEGATKSENTPPAAEASSSKAGSSSKIQEVE